MCTVDIISTIYNYCSCTIADDMLLYVHTLITADEVSVTTTALGSDLRAVADWSAKYGQIPNSSKSVAIISSTKQQVNVIESFNSSTIIDDTIVPGRYSVRNLGLVMDVNLRFKDNANSRLGKCFGALKLLYRIRP